MDTAIRAPTEHAVNCVSKVALVTDDLGFKVPLSIPPERDRRSLPSHLETHSGANWTSWSNPELHCLQLVVHGVIGLSFDERLDILGLLLGPEGLRIASVTAIWARHGAGAVIPFPGVI